MSSKGSRSLIRQWIPIVIGATVAGLLTGWLAEVMALSVAVLFAVVGGTGAALAAAFALERLIGNASD